MVRRNNKKTFEQIEMVEQVANSSFNPKKVINELKRSLTLYARQLQKDVILNYLQNVDEK